MARRREGKRGSGKKTMGKAFSPRASVLPPDLPLSPTLSRSMLGVGCIGAEGRGCRWMVFRGVREERARMRGAKMKKK